MALLLTDALHIPRALADWLQTPGIEESPKTLQRAIVRASCVAKRRICVCWRAAKGLESSHRQLLGLLE